MLKHAEEVAGRYEISKLALVPQEFNRSAAPPVTKVHRPDVPKALSQLVTMHPVCLPAYSADQDTS